MGITRAQKVDYIRNNFEFKGKRITKKMLADLSDQQIDSIINDHGGADAVLKWVNAPKEIMYLVEGTRDGELFSFEIPAASESDLLEYCKSDGIDVEKYVVAKGNHVCKYCGSIAEGSSKDLLCDKCREAFGHSLYSEL